MANNAPLSSGITEATPKKVFLGAGTVHKGLTYSAESGWNFAESLMFATGDGNKLTITPEIIDLEPDGAWVKVAGMLVKVGETAELELSPMEITPELLGMAALAGDVESDIEGYKLLKSKERLETGDYIENFGWVGQTTSGDPVIIIFDFAYCSSGLELEGKNKDKAVPKITVECVQKAGANHKVLPYRIYTPAGTPVIP